MQTILFVSSMTLGTEVQVRQVHEDFPIEALQTGVGIERVASFIGSGFYALEMTVNDDESSFQDRFREFVGSPDVQAFFDRLRPFVDELPAADSQTAELHLATPLFYWERGMSA